MDVAAKNVGGDAWEVSLPRRRSAIRGKSGVKPRHIVHAATEAEAVELGRAMFEREIAAYKMGVTMDLAELAAFFVDHAEADGTYSPETARDYRNVVARYVAPNLAMDADEVAAIDVERLYAHLLTCGGRAGEGVSPGTVRKLNTVLRATYTFLVREGVVASSPMASVELPARREGTRRSLTEREFSKVLDGLEAELREVPGDRAGIERRNALFGAYLGVYIGARVGEVCAITRGDVRAADGTVRLEHSMSESGGLHRKEPKTPSGRRTVALGEGPFCMLREHYAWQATYLTRAQRDSDATPVCCTASGGFIRPSAMSAAFKGFCAGVGVQLADGESFHVLRHTHATSLLSNKVNPELVRERLGHSRIETTFGYSHVMSGEDAAAAADYGEIVDRARKAGGLR